MRRAMDILREIAAENEDVGEDVKVSFSSWGDFALGIRFAFFVLIDRNFRRAENAVNMEILERFGAEGLEFAYPTRTLYYIAEGARG
jgi:MscS family membrane protein